MKQFKHLSQNQSSRGGFSLAELMVVIVILGLLATVVVPKVMEKLAFSQVGKAKLDITSIGNAVTEYAVMNGGRYPDSLEDLITPDVNGNKFLEYKEVPKDPWGHPYSYEKLPSGEGPDFFVWCYGKDGSQGGEGDDRDFNQQMIKDQEI